MTTHEDSPAFAASGYDHQETITADRIVATDAGRDRLVACTDSAVHVVTEDGTVTVEGPEDAVNDDVAVGRSNVCLLADGTVYPLTERGLLGRSYDIDADTIAIPTRSSVVIAATGGEVAGFDIRTGRERFRQPPTGVSDPDTEIGIVAGERRFYALVDGTVVGFDSRGREQFTHEFSAPIEAAGEVGDTLVVALASDRLAWMDAESGEVLLAAPVDVAPHSLVPAADRFLFGVAGDNLVVVDSEEKYATLGDAGTDSLVQTPDGSLVGRVLADGFGVERLRGTPEAKTNTKPDGPGPVVETHNPLPIAVSFSLVVSTEEGDNEESLEYSVNAGETDETPLVPLIDADPGTYLTVSVETEDGETILHEEVGILSTDSQGDDSTSDAGEEGAAGTRPSRGTAGAGRLPADSRRSPRGGYGLPPDPTPDPTEHAPQDGDGSDHDTTEPPVSVDLRLDTLAAPDGATRGELTFRLSVRNESDDRVEITEIAPKRPVKLALDGTFSATTLSPDEAAEATLRLPDRGGSSVPAEVDVHWSRGTDDGVRSVETTVPKERLDVSAEVVDTGERPVVAVTADNRLEATVEDRVTFTADGLAGYEDGVGFDLALSPGRNTVMLAAAEPTSTPPDGVRIDGEAVVGRTEVTFDTLSDGATSDGATSGGDESPSTGDADASEDAAGTDDGSGTDDVSLPATDTDVSPSSDDSSGPATGGAGHTGYSHARLTASNDGARADDDSFELKNAGHDDLAVERQVEPPSGDGSGDGDSITPSVSSEGVEDDSKGLLVDAIRIENTRDAPVDDLSVSSAGDEQGPWRVEANDTAVVGRLYEAFGGPKVELGECVVETDGVRQDVAGRSLPVQQQSSLHVRARLATNDGEPVLTLAFHNTADLPCTVRSIEIRIDGTEHEWTVGLPEIPADRTAVWRALQPVADVSAAVTDRIDVRYELDGREVVQNGLYRVVERPEPAPELWVDASVEKITELGSGDFRPTLRLKNQLNEPLVDFTMEFPHEWSARLSTKTGPKLGPGETKMLKPAVDPDKWTVEWAGKKALSLPIHTEWTGPDGRARESTVAISGPFDPHAPKWNVEQTHVWRLLDGSREADMDVYSTFFEEWPEQLFTPWQRYDP